MTPMDIVNVLTAVAPIATSALGIVSGINNNSNEQKKTEIVVEKEKPVTHNTINISVVNNFYTKPDPETLRLATESQSKLIEQVGSSEKRYDL